MHRAGIFFILAAAFLVGAFAFDLIFVQPKRHLRQIERLDDVREDRLGPEQDPSLYDPTTTDVTDERFMLNAEELDLADREADYVYEVKDGDSIDEIARKYLGRHELKSVIYRENPGLPRGVRLEPGTRITIPLRYRR